MVLHEFLRAGIVALSLPCGLGYDFLCAVFSNGCEDDDFARIFEGFARAEVPEDLHIVGVLVAVWVDVFSKQAFLEECCCAYGGDGWLILRCCETDGHLENKKGYELCAKIYELGMYEVQIVVLLWVYSRTLRLLYLRGVQHRDPGLPSDNPRKIRLKDDMCASSVAKRPVASLSEESEA
jgi:hypothetical protein